MKPPYMEVRFTLPYSLPFAGEFDFDWHGDSFSVKIENVQLWEERSKEVTGFEIHTSGSGSVTLIGDRHGLSHIANVRVRFTGPADVGTDVDIEKVRGMAVMSDNAREQACAAVNRLIDVYREATRDFRIGHVMPQHDVLSLNVELVEEGGGGIRGFGFGSKSKLAYPVKIRGFEEARADFDAMLKSEYRIPTWEEYRHAARRLFEEREFRLAIILMNTALEQLWAALLRAGLEACGDDEAEIDKKLNKWLAAKKTIPTLHREFAAIFGKSLESENPALWDQLGGARDLRKSVIHPFIKTPSAEETFQAMAAIELTMRWLASAAESQARIVRKAVP